MRLKARLNVMEDSVLCPSACELRPIGECATCSALQGIVRRGPDEAVLCEPKVNRRMSEVLEDMIRA